MAKEGDAARVGAGGGNGEDVEGGSGRVVRFSYGMRELEDLKFVVDEVEQRRWWNGVLEGLGSVVVEDYNSLSASQQKKKKNKWKMETGGRSDNWVQAKNRKNEVTEVTEGFVPFGNIPLSEAGKNVCIHDSYGHPSFLWNIPLSEVGKSGSSNNMEHESMNHGEVCDEDKDKDITDEYFDTQRLAFYVEGEPDFDSGPPLDGLEYLRRARYEAAQFPKVKAVKLGNFKCKEQTPYMPNIPDITKCPENLMPRKQWEDNFLADFLEMRQFFFHLESIKDETVATQSKPVSKYSPISLKSDVQLLKSQHPTVSLLLASNPLSRAALLKKFIADFKNTTTLSRESCLWIYSLCVAVDSPLDAEMSATMRSLLRKCSSLLAQKTQHDTEVAMLNVLVVIAGNFFRQSERVAAGRFNVPK